MKNPNHKIKFNRSILSNHQNWSLKELTVRTFMASMFSIWEMLLLNLLFLFLIVGEGL